MTGRDYKQLIKLHRETKNLVDPTNEYNKTLAKLVDKNNFIKYEPVNYHLLKEFIKERKEAGVNSLDKVKKIEQTTKTKKEAIFKKLHSIIWLKEWSKLLNQAKNIETELEDYWKLLEHNSVEYMNLNTQKKSQDYELLDEESEFFDSSNQIDELEDFSNRLNEEKIKFKVRTILPINDLREDLQFYLRTHPNESLRENHEQNVQILQTVKMIKQQQSKIMQKLENEFTKENEEVMEMQKFINKEEQTIIEGIPSQAFELECPNDELKLSVLQEFLIIDYKYKEKLKQLEDNYNIIESNKYGGWTQKDNDLFQHIHEQYHFHSLNLVNSNFTLRDLMFDRMRRTLLECSNLKVDRVDLVKHEEWSDTHKYYQQQQKLILNEWQESRKSLLVKAEAIFAEAFEMIEREKIKKEEKEKQLKLCNDLYEKVSKWRNQKLEALEIQQKIDELIKKQNAEKMRIENEKKNLKRQQQKQAISDFKNRLDMQKRQQEEIELERLERLNNSLSEQAQRDKERISYRNKLMLDKKLESLKLKQIKNEETEAKEKRLEKFYDSVKPHVEFDPERLVKNTESTLNRRGVRTLPYENDESKYEDKKPMFNNFSFNDRQLNLDTRVRLEQRLRQAGLINSEYARTLIATLKPPTQPRRDIYGNSCWDGFTLKK